MKKRITLILAMIAIFTLLLAACGGGAEATEEADTAAGTESILARVQDRGTLVCGGRTDLTGFGYLDADGNNIGFDIDLCRAVAAAVLGDPDAIEVVPLTAADRGPALQTAEVDILSRNMTWTASREAQWGNFTIVMFYDAQTFMTRVDSGIESPEDFDGATVCVTSGTTTEANLNQYFADNGWEYEAVIFEETAAVYSAYESGRCDLTTSDQSQLYSVRSGFASPDDHKIFDFYISKEPLTPAVPHGDDSWKDIVTIVMAGLINAEELGVTSDNVDAMLDSSDGRIRTLLGAGDDWGYSQWGLESDALAQAIKAVGNYGELYDRYFGVDGMAFELPRGLNASYEDGGVIYAFPIK